MKYLKLYETYEGPGKPTNEDVQDILDILREVIDEYNLHLIDEKTYNQQSRDFYYIHQTKSQLGYPVTKNASGPTITIHIHFSNENILSVSNREYKDGILELFYKMDDVIKRLETQYRITSCHERWNGTIYKLTILT